MAADGFDDRFVIFSDGIHQTNPVVASMIATKVTEIECRKILVVWVKHPMEGFFGQKQPQGMSIVSLIITLVVIGVILWLINLIPMQRTIKKIINVIVVICVVIWLLQVFGVIGTVSNFQVPKFR